jgi:hypothetical protein
MVISDQVSLLGNDDINRLLLGIHGVKRDNAVLEVQAAQDFLIFWDFVGFGVNHF